MGEVKLVFVGVLVHHYEVLRYFVVVYEDGLKVNEWERIGFLKVLVSDVD